MFCGTNFWTSHWGAMWAARGKWTPVGPNSANMKMRKSAHQNSVLPSQGSSEPEGPNRSPPPGGRGGGLRTAFFGVTKFPQERWWWLKFPDFRGHYNHHPGYRPKKKNALAPLNLGCGRASAPALLKGVGQGINSRTDTSGRPR